MLETIAEWTFLGGVTVIFVVVAGAIWGTNQSRSDRIDRLYEEIERLKEEQEQEQTGSADRSDGERDPRHGAREG